ncbi:hypothetical protein AUEXF2481DRAFT_173223 [Aureobasidium subglaciale EXF-2481]|uniref:Uncharacterized protein n=1 Tax=Aureobasidium subglaciale (strain EXF-2481) TaxID=1043005 RepID=A0A074ZLT5_AURSE|nr:uncharacterized protein AUEXF2481DRAFT_173223 [Aureobasidium subglaciale EXF-2481]KEQ99371.1 hypothetical protein AUEXF2481DRAFT_173223 [Aureobasidium subglaciale EXF-2481]
MVYLHGRAEEEAIAKRPARKRYVQHTAQARGRAWMHDRRSVVGPSMQWCGSKDWAWRMFEPFEKSSQAPAGSADETPLLCPPRSVASLVAACIVRFRIEKQIFLLGTESHPLCQANSANQTRTKMLHGITPLMTGNESWTSKRSCSQPKRHASIDVDYEFHCLLHTAGSLSPELCFFGDVYTAPVDPLACYDDAYSQLAACLSRAYERKMARIKDIRSEVRCEGVGRKMYDGGGWEDCVSRRIVS